MRSRTTPLLIATTLLVALPALSRGPADAATITVSYAVGHRDVTINDYGTPALGTFSLRDGEHDMVALCVEADQSHTSIRDAYAPVPNRIDSAELDVVLWLLGDGSWLDDDTATAAAALAWYYADAQRNIGVPVWADGTRRFARISPTTPEPWDALRRFSASHPVGLRSGSTDLDWAERRVAELHRQAVALAGPWSLTAEAASRRVRLTGASGPIAGRQIDFAITTPLGTTSVVATTDANGWAQPTLPDLPDGAAVTATVPAPGVHREWDGAPGIQRMVTATTTTATAMFDVPPMPRFVEVRKTSNDPAIGVAGAQFALLDSSGASAATATTDAAGVARFGAVDPSAHPAPYAVRELMAPPGLQPLADDVAVPSASRDPAQPTIVEIADEPVRRQVRIRKVLTEPYGPADTSGFTFRVRRSDGGFDDELVTGPDGLSDVALVSLGEYEVCETAMPDWALGLVDAGCVRFSVGLDDVSAQDALIVDYFNVVPTTTTTTTTTTTMAPPTTEPTTTTTTGAPTTHPTTEPPPAETTTTSSTIVAGGAPRVSTPTVTQPRTLARTGGGAGHLLDVADIGFVVGVALVAVTGLLPRRPERETAGR